MGHIYLSGPASHSRIRPVLSPNPVPLPPRRRRFTMPSTKTILLSGLSLASEALAAKLIASHFSGPVYTLDLALASPTSGTLSVTGNVTGCGRIPAWLHVDKASETVYCFDESWFGSGVLAQYSAGADARLTLAASAPTLGNSVYGSLYGGADDKSFVITAE